MITDIISAIFNVITALSAAFASIIAFYGVRAWKQQFKGKTDYIIARRYLKA